MVTKKALHSPLIILRTLIHAPPPRSSPCRIPAVQNRWEVLKAFLLEIHVFPLALFIPPPRMNVRVWMSISLGKVKNWKWAVGERTKAESEFAIQWRNLNIITIVASFCELSFSYSRGWKMFIWYASVPRRCAEVQGEVSRVRIQRHWRWRPLKVCKRRLPSSTVKETGKVGKSLKFVIISDKFSNASTLSLRTDLMTVSHAKGEINVASLFVFE